MDKREEFLKKILATFRIEAEENINSLYADLIKLEKETDSSNKKELIELIYRSVHSLKGASRAVNLKEIESVCHAFEGVMAAIRDEQISFSSDIFDSLHNSVDIISELLEGESKDVSDELLVRISRQIDILSLLELGEEVEKGNCLGNKIHTEVKSNIAVKNHNIVNDIASKETINNLSEEKEIKKHVKPSKKKETDDFTIRVSNSKLDKLLLQTEAMIEIRLAARDRKKNLQSILDKLNSLDKKHESYSSKIKSIKGLIKEKDKEYLSLKTADVEDLINLFELASSSIKNIESGVDILYRTTDKDGYHAGVKINNLLDDVKDIITVPFSSLFDVLPKIVRDLAKDLGKEVNFAVEGGETEIDRRVLEIIKSPLIHLLRNSLDYGVESVNDRIKKNKSIKGNVKILVKRLDSNKVEVVVEDDGAGINIEKLKQLYFDNEGKLDGEEVTKKDFLRYIFKSGISTSDIVTDISGRGVGLAIVHDDIEKIGGTVDVETEVDKYTRFRLIMPLSLVTYRGVIFKVSGYDFTVPTSKIEKVVRLTNKEISTIESKNTFIHQGKITPLVDLSDILRLNKENDGKSISVLILNRRGHSIGFKVDSVVGEQEVLVKKFNKQLSRVKYVSGATVLGSGKVVPVLNISDLFKSALNAGDFSSKREPRSKDLTDKKKSILIVEDSVTSRMLLKNILESSGFRVVTAVDGIDGFTKLKEDSFDAVVSDVEMPRQNGFELTERIRNDDETKSTPVVLVTSLSKREHREKGIDVGANAYIVKSSFDNSNLLEILDRLI